MQCKLLFLFPLLIYFLNSFYSFIWPKLPTKQKRGIIFPIQFANFI